MGSSLTNDENLDGLRNNDKPVGPERLGEILEKQSGLFLTGRFFIWSWLGCARRRASVVGGAGWVEFR